MPLLQLAAVGTEQQRDVLARHGVELAAIAEEQSVILNFEASVAGGIPVIKALRESLTGNTVYLQSGSYLAAPGTVEVDSKWGGAKTFFSREGLFMLKCSGVGDLVVSSYGAIQRVDLAAGQSYIVDTGHMVGWEEGILYEVHKAGSWKSSILGGEGLVVRVTGPGRAYIQTRSPDSFLDWLIPKLPTQRS